jgi:hypothetical protein
LKILDRVKAKDVKNAFAALSFGIVGEEAVRSSMATDEIF